MELLLETISRAYYGAIELTLFNGTVVGELLDLCGYQTEEVKTNQHRQSRKAPLNDVLPMW